MRGAKGEGVRGLETAAAAVGYLALAFLLTWRLWTPNVVDRRWIQPGDFSDQFFPWARFLADELAARRLPLWNPFAFAGHPFHADPQAALFYPVSTGMALLLGRGGLGYRSVELELPLHFALGAFAMFLFARRATGSGLGALLAGIAFGFGGFLTSYPAQQLAMLRTAAWLPLLLYCLERALGRGGRLTWLVGAAATLGIMLLAGHTQTALFTLYLGGAYALWRARSCGRGWPIALAAALVPAGLAGGLAAVQLLPTLEFVGISTRERLPYDAAAYGYELKALAGTLLPDWRGEKALYVGVPALMLGALALVRGGGAVRFWGIVAAVALIVSVGGRTFLYQAMFLAAPGWATFRDQERTAAIWSCAVAVLAAYGIAALRDLDVATLRRHARRLGLVTLVAALLAVETLVLWTNRRAEQVNPFDSLAESAVFLALVVGATAALAAAWPRLGRRLGPTLLVALALLDLFSVNGPNNVDRVSPEIVLGREAALRAPRAEGEPWRVRTDDDKLVPPNYGMVWRAPFMSGDSPIQLRRTHELLESREEWRLWQLFNVKYLLSRGDRNDPGLEPVERIADLTVYRNRFSLPRAWAVSDVRVAPDEAAALAIVFSPEIHPGDVAVVEDAPPLAIQPGLPRPDVNIRSVWPNGMELAVKSTGNALVVVADAWHPGWRAELDGAPVPILRTNVAFRGVAVGPGEHVLTMRYRPTSLIVGAVISAASLAVAGALLLLLRRLDRRGWGRASSI